MTQINETDTIAEKQLLGTLILEPERIAEVRNQIEPSDFMSAAHRQLYTKILSVYKDAETIDASMLIREMVNSGERSKVDSASFEVMALIESVTATSLIDHNVATVQEQSRIREIGYLASELIKATHTRSSDDARAIISKLSAMRDGERMPEAITMTQAALAHADWFRRLEDGELTKFNTGIRLFDQDINSLYDGGIMAGQAGVIAGRTGAGKTTVCAWLAIEIARKKRDQRVHIFSLELRPEHIAAKGVQMQIKRDRIGDPKMKRSEITKAAAYCMSSWSDRITISEERTPAQILSRARKMNRDGATLFVLDHLHRIKLKDPRGSTARFEYGEFLRDVTDAAKDDEALWLVAGQLNRDAVKRGGRPMMSDLCESGQIEQHSDFVVGIHYPQPNISTSMELITLKNRFGSAASQRLTVDWKAQTFEGGY
jgi:replicative DNA helicase